MKKLLLCSLLVTSLWAAPVTISGPIYQSDGTTLANGSITISNPAFVAADGHYVAANTRVITVTAGVFSQNFEPGTNSSPHFSYKVTYRLGSTSPDPCTWVVSTSNAAIGDVQTCPASATSVPSANISLSQISTGGGANGACVIVSSGAFTTSSCNASWTVNGTDIYNSNAGNVGIGGTPGSYKFDVTGTLHTSGNATLGADLNVVGADISLNSVVRLSDSEAMSATVLHPKSGAFHQWTSGSDGSFQVYRSAGDEHVNLYRTTSQAGLYTSDNLRLKIQENGGPLTLGGIITATNLAGSGPKYVCVDNNGVLSVGATC